MFYRITFLGRGHILIKKGMRDHKAKLLGHHRQELSFLFSFEMLLNVVCVCVCFSFQFTIQGERRA